MARSFRIIGRFLWLVLLSWALTAPLRAEEITVTVPPDDTPAQSQAADQSPDPTDHPTDAAPSPSAQAQAAPAAPAPTAQAAPAESEPAAPPPAAEAAAPTAPAAVKHKKAKKAAAAAPAKKTTAEGPAGEAAESAMPAKPVKKTKTAKASCLNLTEDACGANSACIWVAAGTNDAGKAVKARCRSMAILKREAEKAAKGSKTSKPEVLPWAANAAKTPASATTTGTVEPVKKKKTKTAAAKKPKPNPPVTPEAAPEAGGADNSAASPADSGGAD